MLKILKMHRIMHTTDYVEHEIGIGGVNIFAWEFSFNSFMS